nr:EcsC family protein [Pontibacillus litoralis]
MYVSEQSVYDAIKHWEQQWIDYQPNDFEIAYDRWLQQGFHQMNPRKRKKLFRQMDQILFHIHAYLQGAAFQNEARERILVSGRIFDRSIVEIAHMKQLTVDQLTYIAQQHVAKGKVYSLAQGGLTGTGGYLLLGADFPLMVVLNLRAVQLIGLTFGHEVNHPYEMMLSLKLFHVATLPKRLQKQGWDALKQELTHYSSPFMYEGTDDLTDEKWFEQPMKQCLKSLSIFMFRKKWIQGLPVISMAIGATLNYRLTRQVTEFALRFYQYRYLIEEENFRYV